MDLIFLNKSTSKIIKTNEEVCVYCNLLIFDTLYYTSIIALAIKRHQIISLLNEAEVIKFFLGWSKEKEDLAETAIKVKTWCDEYKRVMKVKHKSKDNLYTINCYKSIVKDIRNLLFEDSKLVLMEHNLWELFGFVDDKVINILPLEKEGDEKCGDPFLNFIVEKISKRECVFFLDPIINDLFNYINSEATENAQYDFVSIPLWDFPLFIGISYQEMKYTRDQLQDVFKPFNASLEELLEKLLPLPFTQENLPEIKQLYQELISQHINPVKEAMDESIYLLKQKNSLSKESTLSYCLGITSAEILIDFYEKTEIILPYVASEIKQQVSRHIDLKTAFVFTYCIKEKDKIIAAPLHVDKTK